VSDTAEQLAEWTGVAPSTWNRLRYGGRGPKFTKLGGCVRYRACHIFEYMDKRTKQSTSEASLS
jgi:hypothetical protein